MRTKLLTTSDPPVAECAEAITRADQAADLLGACIGSGAHGIIIDAAHLPAEFFDLKSRFAGEFVQKFVNYRIRLAVVITADSELSDRFKEFALEARKGQGFRITRSRAEAEAWLAGS